MTAGTPTAPGVARSGMRQKAEPTTAVSGADVMLETKSVVRADGIVTATVRVLLQPPIKTASGELKSSRSVAMIDCSKQTVATKETWHYFDEAGTKEGMHRKPGMPGFGPATKGSLMSYPFCHSQF